MNADAPRQRGCNWVESTEQSRSMPVLDDVAPMLLRLLVVSLLSAAGLLPTMLPTTAWSAEIYTFGKRSDGTRYVKNIDRPRKADDPQAKDGGKSSGNVPPPVSTPRTTSHPLQSLPPPIPDRHKLDLLDKPI